MERLREHVCNLCQNSFSSASSLRAHRWSHARDRPFECNQCNATFAKASALTAHEVWHAKDSQRGRLAPVAVPNLESGRRSRPGEFSDSPVRSSPLIARDECCTKCGAEFTDVLSMWMHKKQCIEHECSKCGLCFTHASALQAHQWSHREIETRSTMLAWKPENLEHTPGAFSELSYCRGAPLHVRIVQRASLWLRHWNSTGKRTIQTGTADLVPAKAHLQSQVPSMDLSSG